MNTQQSESLLDRTYRLLAERDISLREISEQAQIDESWLAKFHRRAIPNPGVNLVQKLHDFLANRSRAA